MTLPLIASVAVIGVSTLFPPQTKKGSTKPTDTDTLWSFGNLLGSMRTSDSALFFGICEHSLLSCDFCCIAD